MAEQTTANPGQTTGGTATAERDGGGTATQPPQQTQGAPGNGAPAQPEESKQMDPRRRQLLFVGGIILAVIAIVWGIKFYHYSITHASTDDAYVTGNLVNVSPIVSGTLNSLTVDEGDVVKQGELIARLEDSGPADSMKQARAAYAAAVSEIPQAKTNLTYEEQSTNAAIQHAEAELGADNAKTQGAQRQVELTRATQANQVRQAISQLKQAQAQALQADAQTKAAQAQVISYRQAVQTAQSGEEAAQTTVTSAVANQNRDAREEARYRVLLQQAAVTPEQYDEQLAALQTADAQVAGAKAQVAQAASEVATAQANEAASMAQYKAAQQSANAVHEQGGVALAGLSLAEANFTQIGIQRYNFVNNQQIGSQAAADLSAALAGKEQIALRQQEITTARAQARQAQEALADAQVLENDTYIYAPSDGTVVRKAVNVGAALSPGETIVTMTYGDQNWVEANYKETQLTDVRPGQPAEIEVDAFPGKIFQGYVQSINEATGASTALLPPDNATGNFTKVVQRIPVKIILEPSKDDNDQKYATKADIANLRQGMSVTATIDTSSVKK